jgi:hypothetical protein
MASNSIGKWSAQAFLDATGFTSGITKMMGGIQAFVKGPNGIGMLTNLPAALGLSSIEGVFSRLNDTLERELDLGFLNDQLGTSIEFLSTLRTVAGENSVGADQFSAGMARMNQVIGQAIMGGESEIATLERLGLTMEEIQNQNFEETFMKAARGLAAITDRAVRARTAMELFGRQGGGNMLRFVTGLDGAFSDAQSRGGFTTEEDLRRFKEMDDAIDRMTTAWENMWRRWLSAVAPTLTDLANGMSGVGDSMVANAEQAERESRQRLSMAQIMQRFREFRETGDSTRLNIRDLWAQGLAIPPEFVSGSHADLLNLEAIQNQVESLEAFAAMDAAEAAGGGGIGLGGPGGLMLGMATFGAVMQQATEASRRFLNSQIEAARQNEMAMTRLRALVEEARGPVENFGRAFREITTSGLGYNQMALLLGQRAQELIDTIPSGQLSGGVRAGSAEDATLTGEAIARRLEGGPIDRMRQALEVANQQRSRLIELGRELLTLRKTGEIQDILGIGGAV